MSGSIRVPAPGTPLVAPKTGELTLIGRQFFSGLISRVYGSTGAVAALNGNANEEFAVANAKQTYDAVPLGQLNTITATLASLNGSSTQVFNVAQAATQTEAVPLGQLNVVAGGTPLGLTVTSSPFSFTAPESGSLSISGSGVVSVQISRGATTIPIARHYGLIPLRYKDVIVLHYAQSVPVLEWLPN